MLIDLSIEEKRLQEGTSFSAAIVVIISYSPSSGNISTNSDQAGQAACTLSDPLFHEELKWNFKDIGGARVGNRLKNWFSREGLGSFQRVSREDMLDPTSTWE